MDISFENNQTFSWSLIISPWAPVFPLSLCTFHMQIRADPAVNPILYAWSSDQTDGWGNGTITFEPTTGLLYLFAPKNDMIKLIPGVYEYDLVLIYQGFYKALCAGTVTITQGITR